MTIQQFLDAAIPRLKAVEIPSARLDCFILLEDVLGIDRATILAHPETTLTKQQVTTLNKQIIQRSSHVPLAYIRGKVAFFGRTFVVNKQVLIPRPETEIMIELLKDLPLPTRPKIVDVGTGSGCIGITVALELPDAHVVALDIDPQALKVARQNAANLAATIELRQADLLGDRPQTDVIITNLPYVPENHPINQAAQHEPKHAIFAGQDGLDLYRQLWGQIAGLPHQPVFVLTESLSTQHKGMTSLAQVAGYNLYQSQDLIQVFKCS